MKHKRMYVLKWVVLVVGPVRSCWRKIRYAQSRIKAPNTRTRLWFTRFYLFWVHYICVFGAIRCILSNLILFMVDSAKHCTIMYQVIWFSIQNQFVDRAKIQIYIPSNHAYGMHHTNYNKTNMSHARLATIVTTEKQNIQFIILAANAHPIEMNYRMASMSLSTGQDVSYEVLTRLTKLYQHYCSYMPKWQHILNNVAISLSTHSFIW